MHLLDVLARQPKGVILTFSIALTLLLGAANYISGPEISFSVFYLMPIALVTWYVGRRWGVLASIAGALTWLSADLLASHAYSSPLIPCWNMLVRGSFFLINTWLIAELHRRMEQEKIISHSDPLTGLANRLACLGTIQSELARCARYGHPLTIAYCDLDNFKQVNDREGHHVGDKLLCTVAGILQSGLRRSNLAARLGGDEFAVLMPESTQDKAREALDRLQGALLQAMRENGWPVTFSIGAITALRPSGGAEELIRRVDALMYRVKHSGKNRIEHELLEAA